MYLPPIKTRCFHATCGLFVEWTLKQPLVSDDGFLDWAKRGKRTFNAMIGHQVVVSNGDQLHPSKFFIRQFRYRVRADGEKTE